VSGLADVLLDMALPMLKLFGATLMLTVMATLSAQVLWIGAQSAADLALAREAYAGISAWAQSQIAQHIPADVAAPASAAANTVSSVAATSVLSLLSAAVFRRR